MVQEVDVDVNVYGVGLESVTLKGTVLWLNRNKAYGIVRPETGKAVLMHARYSGLEYFDNLVLNQPVQFEMVHTPKGLLAGNVFAF